MAEPQLDIGKVSFIISKAREFGAPEGTIEEDDDQEVYEERQADRPINFDDDEDVVTTAIPDDPAYHEAKSQIDDMNIEEQCNLVTLAWIGRGDFGPTDWAEARKIAREEHNNRTAEYLLGMPNLASYLRAGLEAFDIYIEED